VTEASQNDELDPAVVEEAERLTRLARDALNGSEAEAYRERRDELVAEHDYETRIRGTNADATLVCYPSEWIEDGTVQLEAVTDTERAVEISLAGAGDPEDWDGLETHNRAIVDVVRREHGEPHAEVAAAFADFMGNHYARPVESASRAECLEFCEEYAPRNAWLSDSQEDSLEAPLAVVFREADAAFPLEN